MECNCCYHLCLILCLTFLSCYNEVDADCIQDPAVLGIRYPSLETASVVTRLNFLQVLLNDGLTSRLAYSLWLDNDKSPRGQLIFAGVNIGKSLGTLETIPMFTQSYMYTGVSVGLSRLELSYNGVNYIIIESELQLLVDTYSADMWLPTDVAFSIHALLGVTSESGGHPQFPCSFKGNAPALEFSLGSFFISIPMSQLILQNSTSG